MITSLLVAVIFALSFLLFYRFKMNQAPLGEDHISISFALLLVIGLAVRIVISLNREGYIGDINLFKQWGETLGDVGLKKIYTEDLFLDYPPGYLYILRILDFVRELFGIEIGSITYTTILKLPAIFCDLAIAGLAFYLMKQSRKEDALFITALVLMNPAILANSSEWGQIDSVLILFVLLSILFLSRNRENEHLLAKRCSNERVRVAIASVLYGLAILTKPQALLLGPVYLFYVIQSKDWRIWVISILTGIFTILLFSFPFSENLNFTWLIERYWNTLNGYQDASLNAYNIYTLFGLNWVKIQSVTFLGLPLELYSLVLGALVLLYAGIVYFKSANQSKFAFAAYFIVSGFYMLVTKMHERYLLLAMIMLLLVIIQTADKRLLFVFFSFSITHYLNVAYIMPQYRNEYGPWVPMIRVISFINVLLFAYSAYVSYDLYLKKKKIHVKHSEKEFSQMNL